MPRKHEQRRWSQARMRVTRRDLIGASAGGIGLAAMGVGMRGVHNHRAQAQTEIEATPPAVPVEADFGAFGPTIASRAAELGYDRERIVRFVTDEIRYEPYAGALRGASATMWGLAGNSVDQAILLSALLSASQITWRFAAGPLDDRAATALLDAANAGITSIDASWQRAVEASLTPTPNLGTPIVDDASADDAIVADVMARGEFASKTGDERFGQLASQVGAALDRAGIVIGPARTTVLPDLERQRHVWVQVADGPRWIDCDPSLPSTSGDAVPKPAETFDTVPEDLVHMLTVRISAETLSGTAVIATDAVSEQFTALEAARTPIEIGVSPPQAFAAAGNAITEAIAGSSSLVPYLAASDAVIQAATTTVPFSIGGGALGVLGAATPEACGCQDGELVSLSYLVDITSPGAEPVTIQRYLLDRLSPSARATVDSGIDPTALMPLTLTQLGDGVAMPVELAAATFLTVTTGDLPALYSLLTPGPDFGMKGIASIGTTQSRLAAAYMRPRMLPDGVHVFVSAPQVVAFTAGSDASSAEGSLALMGDILRQERTLMTKADGVAIQGLHPLVVNGILGQVAESVVLEPSFLIGSGDAPIIPGRSVGQVFVSAAEQKIAIVAIANGSGSIPEGIAADVSGRIQQALDAGKVIVIPEKPVSVDGMSTIGWWEIDPLTGQTVDVFANGKGYAEAHGPSSSTILAQDAAEEAEILKEVNTWRPWYQRLGRCVGMAAMVAGSAIDPTTFNPGSGSAEGAVKAGIKILTRNPNILNDLKNLAKCY